jgi:hypothetical protein
MILLRFSKCTYELRKLPIVLKAGRQKPKTKNQKPKTKNQKKKKKKKVI